MDKITIYHYLFLGLLLFVTGIAGSVLSRNVIKMLISIEFILTGVNINFAAFAAYCDSANSGGFIIALFYTALGAAELAVALYIFYLMYIKKQSEEVDKYGDL